MKLIRGSTCKSEINVHYVNQKYSFNSQLVNKVVNVNNVCNHTKTSRKENATEKYIYIYIYHREENLETFHFKKKKEAKKKYANMKK